MSFSDAVNRANASVFKTLGVPAHLDYQPVVGIFDNGFAQAFDGIATAEPSFLLPSEYAASVTQSSVLIIGGVTYRVRVPRHDGTGLCSLLLEKQ